MPFLKIILIALLPLILWLNAVSEIWQRCQPRCKHSEKHTYLTRSHPVTSEFFLVSLAKGQVNLLAFVRLFIISHRLSATNGQQLIDQSIFKTHAALR